MFLEFFVVFFFLPEAAKVNGASFKSGQSTTSTLTVSKLVGKAFDKTEQKKKFY